jgi:hypothetical protein
MSSVCLKMTPGMCLVIMFSSMQVPWNRLGKDPVIVLLDRIYILAEPLQDDRTFTVSTGICIL